jgi:hypothetical protein
VGPVRCGSADRAYGRYGSLSVRTWSAEHAWRPSTLAGHRSIVAYLVGDSLATRRAVDLSPSVMRAACAAWRTRGWPDPAIWARVLRSALGWAHAERVLDRQPLDGMRGPPQARIRQHAPVETVRAILARCGKRA